jgi:dihydrofolate reductase
VLIYSAIASLDGYTADQEGKFDWAAPDEEVLAAINDLERPIGTCLYGRRMYEVMRYWEDFDLAGHSAGAREFAEIWRSADKVVYSTSLTEAPTARTRIERSFDADAVLALKQQGDVSIGGPTLAARAIKAGLVDEYQLFVTPVVVGGGLPALPSGVRASLDLVDESRFAGGVVYLRYRARRLGGSFGGTVTTLVLIRN